MLVSPTHTTTLLLEGLHDPGDVTAWSQFDRRYRPVILGFALQLGLDDADAADVAQETMSQFITLCRVGRRDRRQEPLQSWLRCLARSQIARLRHESVERQGRRHDWCCALTDDARLTRIWERECRRVMMRKAMHQLRTTTRISESTITAFELLVVSQMPVSAVADRLGMQIADVYAAKSRVARRLREILAALEVAYTEA